MAKYKPYSCAQGQFIPVFFDRQILPGTFEYTLNYLIDNELDLKIFDKRFHNDNTGAPAYDPRILLKVILYAYSKGITSSRKMAGCCEENIVFMALSANSRPHFTTIADFISSMQKEVVDLFLQILLVCDHQKLIGKEMFAIDGCKLPSNASKQWSGTKADLTRKVAKMEAAIARMVEKHQSQDKETGDDSVLQQEEKYLATLQKNAAKIKKWLDAHDDRKGCGGKPIKSNITDNESAKMKTGKGVIQGYVGVSAVDKKHQVIVSAEAYGQGQEHDLLMPSITNIEKNFSSIGNDKVLDKAIITADSGYHSEENMKSIFTEDIDGYIADPHFRKRDPRFADALRYKESVKTKKLFTPADFSFPDDFSYCVCPAGKRMYRSGCNTTVRNFKAIKFKGPKSACVPCELRSRCLRKPDTTEIRQVAYFTGRSAKGKERFTEKMKQKIDSVKGRAIYGLRLAVAEPPFAHIRSILGLDRFSLRGKRKVNIQWNLFCIVHNITKIFRYGTGFA